MRPRGTACRRRSVRMVVVVMALTMVAAGCGGSDNKSDGSSATTAPKAKIDYASRRPVERRGV